MRLAGARAAVTAACDKLGGIRLDPGDALGAGGRSVRDQTHDFFALNDADVARGECLWRLSVPATAAPLELPGSQFIEWHGARALVAHRGRGCARCAPRPRAGRPCHAHARRRQDPAAYSRPLNEVLMRIHRGLKQAFDPARHLQPRAFVRGALSAMQTQLSSEFAGTPEGEEAAAILRKCVHCGFCNATCPTYQLLGDELDGPRGRIYLIKQVLEGGEVTRSTQQHLDRCLTCLNCQTTCPSGVEYGHLVDIGRKIVDARVERPLPERATSLVAEGGPHLAVVRAGDAIGQALRPLLPKALRDKVPAERHRLHGRSPHAAWTAVIRYRAAQGADAARLRAALDDAQHRSCRGARARRPAAFKRFMPAAPAAAERCALI